MKSLLFFIFLSSLGFAAPNKVYLCKGAELIGKKEQSVSFSISYIGWNELKSEYSFESISVRRKNGSRKIIDLKELRETAKGLLPAVLKEVQGAEGEFEYHNQSWGFLKKVYGLKGNCKLR